MWFLVLFESLRASRTSKKILNSDFDSLEMRFNIKEKKKIWWEWKNRLIDRKQRKEFLFLLYWVYDCWSIEWVSIIFLNLFRFISKEIAFSFNKKCVEEFMKFLTIFIAYWHVNFGHLVYLPFSSYFDVAQKNIQ